MANATLQAPPLEAAMRKAGYTGPMTYEGITQDIGRITGKPPAVWYCNDHRAWIALAPGLNAGHYRSESSIAAAAWLWHRIKKGR